MHVTPGNLIPKGCDIQTIKFGDLGPSEGRSPDPDSNHDHNLKSPNPNLIPRERKTSVLSFVLDGFRSFYRAFMISHIITQTVARYYDNFFG